MDAWEEAGAPCMTTKSWAKLGMKVAEKDQSNLQNVFEVAKNLSEKKKESEDAEESDEQAADMFVNRNDLGQKKQKKGP
eukprot:7426406-Lingulodinium_polyedra.AAC.1